MIWDEYYRRETASDQDLTASDTQVHTRHSCDGLSLLVLVAVHRGHSYAADMLPRLLLGALLGALAVAAAPALAERSAAVDAERQIGPLMPCSQCQLVCFAKHLYQPKFDCRSICRKSALCVSSLPLAARPPRPFRAVACKEG